MGKKLYFVALVVMLVGYQMMPGRASSHREAPLISSDPLADNTDVYAFMSPDAPDWVTLIASFVPFEDPAGGPNFYKFGDNVLYEIKIDNNGDARRRHLLSVPLHVADREPEHVPLRHRTDQGARRSQPQPVPDLHGDAASRAAAPSSPPGRCGRCTTTSGPASTPNYGGNGSGIYEFSQADGTIGRVFAGQTDDAFFLDLRVFDFLYGGNLSETGTDSLAGFNNPQHRDPGPTVLGAIGQPDHRRLVDRQPSGDDDAHGRHRNDVGQHGAGVAPRHAARQRSGDPARPEGQVERQHAGRRRAVPELRHRSGSAEAAAGGLRPHRAVDAAQRPGTGVPHRRAEPESARRACGRARCSASTPTSGRPRGRRASACSPATSRASRTGAGSPTT